VTKPIPGVPLVKAFDGDNPSKADDAMADDVVEILREGLRGSADGPGDGGVEPVDKTTLEQDQARQTEAEFFRAIAAKLKERVGDWANGKRGLACADLGTRDGWRFGLYDKDGRLFEIEVTFSEIAAIAAMQRSATISNFEHTLDRIVAKFQEARRTWFARRDGVTLQ
jgi:hypothetical protein